MGEVGGGGMETQKKTPRPGLFSGAGQGMGPGARCFWGPGGPVTNASENVSLIVVSILEPNGYTLIVIGRKKVQLPRHIVLRVFTY